jgi:hypothetical protein
MFHFFIKKMFVKHKQLVNRGLYYKTFYDRIKYYNVSLVEFIGVVSWFVTVSHFHKISIYASKAWPLYSRAFPYAYTQILD